MMSIDPGGSMTVAGNMSVTGALTAAAGSFTTLGATGTITANTNTGGWSSNNVGRQIVATSNGANPGIAITAVGGGNIIGLVNNGGTFQIAAMPALNDSSTPPTVYMTLSPSGVTINARAGFNNTSPIAKPTGWGAPTGTATRATFVTGSVTLATLAEHVKAMIDDLTAYGLIGA